MLNDESGDNVSKEDKECINLLKSLKRTAEWLLSSYSCNVWNTYGSLSRVCNIVDEILSHGLLEKSPEKYLRFLCGIQVSNLEETQLTIALGLNKQDHNKERMLTYAWLQRNLLDHCLSSQLLALIEDNQHVNKFYSETAFLRNVACTDALFMCLNAIEQNQPSLLENLVLNHVVSSVSLRRKENNVMIEVKSPSTSLYFNDLKDAAFRSSQNSTPEDTTTSISNNNINPRQAKVHKPSPKKHRSHCNQHIKRMEEWKLNKQTLQNSRSCTKATTNNSCVPEEGASKHCVIPKTVKLQRSKSFTDVDCVDTQRFQKCHSFPVLCQEDQFKVTDKHLQLNPAKDCDFSDRTGVDGTWKAQHSRSKSDGVGVLNCKSGGDDVHRNVDNFLCSSMPSILAEKDREQQQQKKSILEGGVIVATTECFFPRPQPGQTLTSFLSSDFNIYAELDRENAHFCISEALISAIEQIKCTETMRMAAEEVESDEEIKHLTQRIRIRRRERLKEKAIRNTACFSDGKTDTTTSQSVSPMSTSHSSDLETADSIGSDDEDVHDLEVSDQTATNLTSVKESGLSLSMASMYSEADIQKGLFIQSCIDNSEKRYDIDPAVNHLSAEAVALSLLKRFSEKQLPKASDLEWLISEQEVPQRLLPLPDSWPVAPDAIDEEYDLEKTNLRGNFEWAPPRQQIIFIIHPEPRKKDAVLKQNYRCAGCGMKVERNYVKKFRYCDYLGKFFCQCCHANNLALIPGRVLWKWDFKHYYVSKFSWKLLDQMFYDPLFNVMDINCKLYRKIRQLDTCREYRIQLFYLVNFIRTCRNCEHLQMEINCLPQHTYSEPHLYSIDDFLKVKSGDLNKVLSIIVSKSITHVMQCILCQAKGFICEMCNKFDDIIFPFQLAKVCRCDVCGACFHKNCFKVGLCPKCVRINERKRKQQERKEANFTDEEL